MDINMMRATRALGHYNVSEFAAAKRQWQRIEGELATPLRYTCALGGSHSHCVRFKFS